jgi:hypothetical protein
MIVEGRGRQTLQSITRPKWRVEMARHVGKLGLHIVIPLDATPKQVASLLLGHIGYRMMRQALPLIDTKLKAEERLQEKEWREDARQIAIAKTLVEIHERGLSDKDGAALLRERHKRILTRDIQPAKERAARMIQSNKKRKR